MELMGDDLYVLANKGNGPGNSLRLLRASMHDRGKSTLLQDWKSLDLSVNFKPLSFRLACGSVLHFDPRILSTRSEFFQKMLTSGCMEATSGEVDFRNDRSIS